MVRLIQIFLLVFSVAAFGQNKPNKTFNKNDQLKSQQNADQPKPKIPASKFKVAVGVSGPSAGQIGYQSQLQWVLNKRNIPQLVVPMKLSSRFSEIRVINKGSEEASIFKPQQNNAYDFYVESTNSQVYIDGVGPTNVQIGASSSLLLVDPSCAEAKIQFKLAQKSPTADNKFVGFACEKIESTGTTNLYVTHFSDHEYFIGSLFESEGKGMAYKKYALSSQIIAQTSAKIGFFKWKTAANIFELDVLIDENIFKSGKSFLKADVGLGFNAFQLVQNSTNTSKANCIISYGDVFITPFSFNSRFKFNWYNQITDISSATKIPIQSSKTSIGMDYYINSDNYEFVVTAYTSFINAYSFEISAFNTMQATQIDLTLATFAFGRNYKFSTNLGVGFATGEAIKGNYIEVLPKLHFAYSTYTFFTGLLYSSSKFQNATNNSDSVATNTALLIGSAF